MTRCEMEQGSEIARGMIDGMADGQFHLDPSTYVGMVRADVPVYDELQDAVARATTGLVARRVLASRRFAGAELRVGRLQDPLPGGRFDQVTPLDRGVDRPDSLADQLRWLHDAGLVPSLRWQHRDLVVVAADPLV